ncbi:serine protease inhibitor 3/4 isoform X4 [Anoplophora glabripennis]|uniref:serine protease inhibitor 3/4 isoform X4 n=1 Tax=Anoplophora glabripennis TaxID=217634 RepID=UPI0008739935|nr:serine protease inhibitor 3/4 isoform X4 [Anoplophora glabripennis]
MSDHRYEKVTRSWFFYLYTCGNNAFSVVFLLVGVVVSSNLIMAEEQKELKAVLHGNGELTKNLYNILAKKPGNVFFSPISIHAILSLVYQGSRGRTQEAFTKALNVPDVRVAAKGYKDVMSRLNSVKDVTLLIANKVFLQESYKLQQDFSTVAVQQFSSEVELLNFKQPKVAASSINTWVENKTNNKIRDLINPEDLDDNTVLVLVNAIYFKGKWALPFDVHNTRTEKFYLNDVDTVDVQMMHIKKKFFYKEDANLNAKVLELPYSNKNISLIVILPNERNGIADLEQKLASTDIMKITENMHKPEVEVALPKFKIEQTIDLQDSLTELGLGVIFDQENAELTGIIETKEQLYVSKAVQKAFIEVNEEGAEAAAATGMVFSFLSMSLMPPPVEKFIADHPFFIILRSSQDDTTNVLFGGRVSKPKYN